MNFSEHIEELKKAEFSIETLLENKSAVEIGQELGIDRKLVHRFARKGIKKIWGALENEMPDNSALEKLLIFVKTFNIEDVKGVYKILPPEAKKEIENDAAAKGLF